MCALLAGKYEAAANHSGTGSVDYEWMADGCCPRVVTMVARLFDYLGTLQSTHLDSVTGIFGTLKHFCPAYYIIERRYTHVRVIISRR